MVECIIEVLFSFSVQFLWNKIGFVRQALHHPFTAPHPDDMGDLRSARALAYDLVYNGVEVRFISMCSKWSTILHLLICCIGLKRHLFCFAFVVLRLEVAVSESIEEQYKKRC
jgi:aspartyl-tRNA synthetase